ncbi:MAG TPA: Maf family protein [Dongiaceae bacterium]|nr:Maf family protein [Dongiaceae bacterium]
MALLLASASPRRRDLLAQIGIRPDRILPASIDESPRKGEVPHAYVRRMALEKLAAVRPSAHPDEYILSADTVVACGRRILGKAGSENEARAMLRLLSGRRHRVLGGIAVATPDGKLRTRTAMSRVRFLRLAPRDIDSYIDSGEWHDKAGAYAVQGLAARFIPWIEGSYTNIVGLSLSDVSQLLVGLGYR